MNAQAIEKPPLIKKHAKRLLYAAASAVGAQVFCAAAGAQTPANPTITECQVYQSQSLWMEGPPYNDYDYKPEFTVDWETSVYSGNSPAQMFFWFGNNCTDVGNTMNVWQVFTDPVYNSTNTFALMQDADVGPETFFPWQQGYLNEANNIVWNGLADIDYDTTYEIGLQATDGNKNNSSIVWCAASFND